MWVFTRAPQSQPKPILTSSRRRGLVGCVLHLLPASFSIVGLVLNLKHYYIGVHLQGIITEDSTNLALLQVAAKMQELLITASLSRIVFHIIRSELIYGDGIPLGWLESGFAFTRRSYFWSPEFWYSRRYDARRWKKLGLFGSLVVAGALAAFASSASAVLITPRLEKWQAGGTTYFLNGTADEIWPTRLSFESSDNPEYCTGEHATTYGVCPSGGFQALWSHYNQVNVSNFLHLGTKLPYAGSLVGSEYFYETGPEHQMPARITLGNVRRESGASVTFLAQSHAASTIFQRQLTFDWYNAAQDVRSNSADNIARYHSFSHLDSRTTTQVPSVGVQCSPAQNLSSDSKVLEFPTLPFETRERRRIEISNINSTSADHLRFGWAAISDLDDVSFPGVTAGLYIEMPWSNDQSRVVIGCSVRATWLVGLISHAGPAHAFYTEGLKFETMRDISVDSSWLDALTPKTPIAGPGYFDWGPSTLQSILITSGVATSDLNLAGRDKGRTDTELWNSEDFPGGSNRSTFLESIISSHFVDGLARTGSHKAYNMIDSPSDDSSSGLSLWSYEKVPNYNRTLLRGEGALEHPAPSQKFTELKVEVTIDGYAFRASAVSDYLSVAVISFHILIALGHTAWCLWFNTSSGCWDSITELLTLALNSQPAPSALKNTGAGIETGGMYSKKAKIRARSSNHDEIERVELLFEDAAEQDDTEMQPLKSCKGCSSTPSIQGPEYEPTERELKRPSMLGHNRSISESTLRPLLLKPSSPAPGRDRAMSASTLQADTQGYISGARERGLVEVDRPYG